jgi:hypothetical protein
LEFNGPIYQKGCLRVYGNINYLDCITRGVKAKMATKGGAINPRFSPKTSNVVGLSPLQVGVGSFEVLHTSNGRLSRGLDYSLVGYGRFVRVSFEVLVSMDVVGSIPYVNREARDPSNRVVEFRAKGKKDHMQKVEGVQVHSKDTRQDNLSLNQPGFVKLELGPSLVKVLTWVWEFQINYQWPRSGNEWS